MTRFDFYRFLPDKQSGFALLPETHQDYKSSLLGMKLTYGFEMIANNAIKTEQSVGKIDVSCASYKNFLKKLTDSGYFQGELEGSKKYGELFNKANDYFGSFDVSIQMPHARFSSELLQVLTNSNQESQVELDPEDSLPSDDESWLDVDPDSFDSLLRQHFKLRDVDPSYNNSQSQAEIPTEVKRFLQGLSDFDGIQVYFSLRS